MSQVNYKRINFGHTVFETTDNQFKRITNLGLPSRTEGVLGRGKCMIQPTTNPAVYSVVGVKPVTEQYVQLLYIYADGTYLKPSVPPGLEFTLSEDKTIRVTHYESGEEESVFIRANCTTYDHKSISTAPSPEHSEDVSEESQDDSTSEKQESEHSVEVQSEEVEHEDHNSESEISSDFIDFSENDTYATLKSRGKAKLSSCDTSLTLDELAGKYNNLAGLGYAVTTEEYIPEEPSDDDYNPTWKPNDYPQWISSSSRDYINLLPTEHELVDNAEMNFADYSFNEFGTVESGLVHKILKSKSWFDSLYAANPKRFVMARNRSNPYEELGAHIFMSRSSLKAAAIDATCHLTTNYRQRSEAAQIETPMLILDICNGTSPFAEYFLWKLKPRKVIIFSQMMKEGRTLSSNYQRFNCWNEVTLKSAKYSFRLLNGSSSEGDIRKVSNLHSFKTQVLAGNFGPSKASIKSYGGVDLVCADAAPAVMQDFNRQELSSRTTILSEIIFALYTLRVGGDFVIKIYDCFTPFTIDLVYLLYLLFNEITIIKPPTSRAANSEKYVVCKHFRIGEEHRQRLEELITFLESILTTLSDPKYQLPESDEEDFLTISDFIDRNKILCDHQFIDYLFATNNRLAKMQKSSLRRIQRCVADSSVNYNSATMVKNCLRAFDLPKMSSNAEKISSYKFIIEGTSKKVDSLWSSEKISSIERQPVDRRVITPLT